MNRDSGLPSGLANLSDTVPVIDKDGSDPGFMIVAEAPKRALEQNADLFVIDRTNQKTLVRIVEVRKRR